MTKNIALKVRDAFAFDASLVAPCPKLRVFGR